MLVDTLQIRNHWRSLGPCRTRRNENVRPKKGGSLEAGRTNELSTKLVQQIRVKYNPLELERGDTGQVKALCQ